jgi:hypothetical protein
MLSFNLFLSLSSGCLPEGLHIKISLFTTISQPHYREIYIKGRPYIKPFNNIRVLTLIEIKFSIWDPEFGISLTYPNQNNHFRSVRLLFLRSVSYKTPSSMNCHTIVCVTHTTITTTTTTQYKLYVSMKWLPNRHMVVSQRICPSVTLRLVQEQKEMRCPHTHEETHRRCPL